jgi:hypothetical protein
VSFVGMAFPLSRDRKRLTGTRSGPDGQLVRPAREVERFRPAPNAREEMALRVSGKVSGGNIDD